MVKNRKELIEIANDNSKQFKEQLRQAMEAFMDEKGIDVEDVAFALGVDDEDIYEILDGDGIITIDTLSRILVATDMAVQIMPISMTPLREYSKDMPKCGGFDHDEFEKEEKPLFGVCDEPCEKKTELPPRDSKGRFMKKTAVQEPVEDEHNPYLDLDEDDLADIIAFNYWDDEIDLEWATKEEMVDFIMGKEELRRRKIEDAKCRKEEKEPAVKGGGHVLNKFVEMLKQLEKEAEDNPELEETIGRLMGF